MPECICSCASNIETPPRERGETCAYILDGSADFSPAFVLLLCEVIGVAAFFAAAFFLDSPFDFLVAIVKFSF